MFLERLPLSHLISPEDYWTGNPCWSHVQPDSWWFIFRWRFQHFQSDSLFRQLEWQKGWKNDAKIFSSMSTQFHHWCYRRYDDVITSLYQDKVDNLGQFWIISFFGWSATSIWKRQTRNILENKHAFWLVNQSNGWYLKITRSHG